MHHNQDIRWMGGVRKYMPVTWITSMIGSLALIGTPLLSGFYSKDSIIEAVAESHLPAAGFASFAVLAGVFVTAFYSFRMYFLVFHGAERYDQNPDIHHADHDGHGHHDAHGSHAPHESPWVVTLPLILPAIIAGAVLAFAKAMGEFGATITFVANIPGQTQTLPSAIYALLQVPGGDPQAFRLVGISITLSICALLVSELLARHVQQRISGL
jgi:NADH-quinone oxidoreductase subunit L